METENVTESTEQVVDPNQTEMEITEEAVHAPEETQEEVVEEKWEPDFKYKVKDDHFDMEDWVKPLVTSKEIEEKMKVLFSKGHGIEDIKKDRTTLRERAQELEANYTQASTELENMKQSLNLINNWVKEDKLDMVFEALQFPEEKILKYAIERLKYREMDPNQRAQIDAQRTQERRLQEMEWQNQQLHQQQQQAIVSQRVAELDHALSDPKVAGIAQAYDAKAGKPGAFKEQVIMIGNHYDVTYGQDISVQDAVSKAVTQFSGILGTVEQQNTQQAPQQVTQQQKPVIPNVRGRGTSPVKSSPTSIDDLYKLRDQALARESGA